MAKKTKAEAEQTRRQIIDAARCVFHECGVSRTTMEKVAHVAGVSRGAVYWHFENKAALFFAMRDDSTRELDEVRATLISPDIPDPLDAIERSLLEFIGIMETDPLVRQTFEIMSLRCEYVDEFAGVLQELNKPCLDFLARLKTVYANAAELGKLRPGLDPEALAYDTLTFTTGLFNNWLAASDGDDLRRRTHDMIRSHVALRRG